MFEPDYLICMLLLCLPVIRDGICCRLAVASERADRFVDFLLTLVCRVAPDLEMEKTISKLRPALFSRVVLACSPFMLALFTCCIVNQLGAALQHPLPIDSVLMLFSYAFIGLIYGLLFLLAAALDAVSLTEVSSSVPPDVFQPYAVRFAQLMLGIQNPPPRSLC